jgi:plasmid stability protein
VATLTLRRLDPETKARLRLRAAHHGRSMEEEAREILRAALASEGSGRMNLVEFIRARIEPLGGVDLPIAPREPVREPPDFTQ